MQLPFQTQYLQPAQFTKQEYINYLKDFNQKTSTHLAEKGKEKPEGFYRFGTVEFVKHLGTNFENYKIYTGKSGYREGALAFVFTEDN